MKKAAIDIGTNTVLLLAGEIDKGRLINPYSVERAPRLGKGVDAEKNISAEAMDRVIEVLQEYQFLLKTEYPVDEILVTATSAVRDANNKSEFLNRVREYTGLEVHILTGQQEAEYTYFGTMCVLPDYEFPVSVLDIGGGSTEIAYGKYRYVIKEHSFNMGCVRFTERYVKNNPATKDEVQELRKAVQEQIRAVNFQIAEKKMLVACAGTAVATAFILQNLTEFDADKINGFKVTRADLLKLIEDFNSQPFEKYEQKYIQILRGRSDIYLAGLIILDEILLHYHFDHFTVSAGGIRHGVLLKYPTINS